MFKQFRSPSLDQLRAPSVTHTGKIGLIDVEAMNNEKENNQYINQLSGVVE